MENNLLYVQSSLELHLFFARIMKEHAIFLQMGFTQANQDFMDEADYFQKEFENLLCDAIDLNQGFIRSCAYRSGEFVTEYTLSAERMTQFYTNICIDESITLKELNIADYQDGCLDYNIVLQVQQLNCRVSQLLEQYILFKETIIERVSTCEMFTSNYPLLIEHILREAKLYYSYLIHYENGECMDIFSQQQLEQFWNQIMMEHALFIRGLLDPTENKLINTSNDFAMEYSQLLKEANDKNNQITMSSLEETKKFRDFKIAGTKGLLNCEIQSIIIPLLADHVLREANHYLRILESQ